MEAKLMAVTWVDNHETCAFALKSIKSINSALLWAAMTTVVLEVLTSTLQATSTPNSASPERRGSLEMKKGEPEGT